MTFDTIQDAVEDLCAGKPIIVVDDEDRENEGDLVMLAEHATQSSINFMVKYGRGLICTPIHHTIAERLNLRKMTRENTDPHGTAFTVSIDHMSTTTGISAKERANTIKALLNDESTAHEFNRPGHIFPLIAHPKGIHARGGHTEAAIELANLCDSKPVGVICEIMNDDGTMARLDDLLKYKKIHQLKLINIEQLKKHISSIEHTATVNMPTQYGNFTMYGFIEKATEKEHLALLKDKPRNDMPVRIHSECITGDVFTSKRCDCGEQLDQALKIAEQQNGMIIYLRQEGRGIGLTNKLRAYELIEQGYDTVEANHQLGYTDDLRTYHVAADILKFFDINRVKLMSNNPRKINGLSSYDIDVTRQAHEIHFNEINEQYLKTKKEKLGHMLEVK